MAPKRIPPGPSAPTPPALTQKFAQLWEAREELLSPHDILIQAKALMLCALPYKRIPEKSFVKRAQVGREASISVTFSALGDFDLPFGADRALFAWIQTKAYADGFVTFETMREFLDTFGLGDDGHNYKLFNQRLNRLKNLSVSIRLETRDEEMQLNTVPIKAAYTPNSSTEVRRRISDEAAGPADDRARSLWLPARSGLLELPAGQSGPNAVGTHEAVPRRTQGLGLLPSDPLSLLRRPNNQRSPLGRSP